MIGKIKGKLIDIEGNKGLIETASGLSYEVFLVPTIIKNNILGKSLELFTQLIVREDSQTLYGFTDKEQINIFKMLLSISGIGPKVAFGVISFSNSDDLTTAIKNNDIDFFTRVPGLGKKSALKIVVELSGKIESGFSISKIYMSEEDKLVLDALVSLGFKTEEARKIMINIPSNLPVEEKIKKGLQLGTTKKKKV
ncbi:Holliday junction DNA helicase RuvA [Candidatus Roizmanbacteria bacterium RIFCSPHIGHO2_12_FULL_33_9]|uniref:Holliday junction branch migration complex subunit RuvA n=1 Tax=Candidatus Roizmanbacteria bacterium RIFCSPHIGHO2_12_FULL_33_9 TaxID=1802045 RepID=A0A1F7HES8_9BACT|nr:MAG: Holliday junction DNA helicase RuvA [Candidatus Roizmanbacteria bacterium RIFCSPHIGHO2_12_FULL_33_9]